MENKKCNPCIHEGIKPFNRSSETLIIRQEQKKLIAKIKLTSYANGSVKNYFLDDCILRGLAESEVLRQIVKMHYEIINSHPHLKGKEFSEIKSFLITR